VEEYQITNLLPTVTEWANFFKIG